MALLVQGPAFGGKRRHYCNRSLLPLLAQSGHPGPFRVLDGTITMPCSEIGAGMRRREFIGFVSAALVWPVIARAQQADKTPRVAFLGGDRTSPALVGYYQAFSAQLEKNGFREGQNIVIEYRATDDPRGPFVGAAELLRSQPDLIVAVGPEVVLQAVVGASAHIPIVIVAVNYDPIERGYVTSLAQPGGNITGLVVRPLDLARKQIDLLRQAFPDRDRLAVLYDPLTVDQFTAANQAAKSLNLQVQALKLEIPSYDFAGAFQAAAAGGAQLMIVLSSAAFSKRREELAELAVKHRLPTMFTFRHYVDGGGLMSYGVEFPPMWRRIADYVARILKGAKPAELPIEQPTKFELVVNLKTAKAIGVTIPNGILLAADDVIE
jgi:putative tryptophan/tyrosine transport system substrate-binding protein